MTQLKGMAHKELMELCWGNIVLAIGRGECGSNQMYDNYNLIYNWMKTNGVKIL